MHKKERKQMEMALPASKMTFRLYRITLHFLTTLLQLQLQLHANVLSAASSASPAASTRTHHPGGNETDHLALLALKKKIIHDPQGALSSWNNSHPFCKWEGVTCSRRHRRVTVLDLSSRNLAGNLSPYIGNLSFLRQIRLYDNTFQGEFPQEVGFLSRLQSLVLYNNSLSGKIPTNLSACSNLAYLSIDGNALVGKIPTQLAALSGLQMFAFHDNNLTGVIPSFLGNLTSLHTISAARNAFEGKIPDMFGKLKSLARLGLGGNQLSGTIPPSMYNLSSVIELSFSGNQLYGNLLPDTFLYLSHLKVLQAWGNQFSGSIPISLSNASKLETIDLSINNFAGKVSVDFGGLKNLSMLNLWYNNLGGGEAAAADDDMNFLPSLTNCSKLNVLGLLNNQFGGMLPNSVGNLSTNLQYLGLSDNQLSGAIPSSIGYLANVALLQLGVNKFTGTIPSEMGNLGKLQRLTLNDNRLSGEIPFSLGNLSSLTNLYLQHNILQGAIPSNLGNLQRLLSLDLSKNNFIGTIPNQLFAVSTLSISLNLAENQLTGPLPPSVGNLTNLVELDLSKNRLSGEIPSEIGRCLGLENLYIAGNFFHGPIPSTLNSLKGIQNLNFSSNNLSGQIPKYLEGFPLKSLNLSFNDFVGEVPTKGVFSNVSAFSVTGNHRICGGIVELKLPKCTSLKKPKMSRALLVTIPIASALVGVMIITVFVLCYCFMKPKKQQFLGLFTKESFLRVSYQDLLKATDGFSSTNLIGVGSFGSVYKGILNETTVAVKVIDLQRRGASKSFTAECEALRNIRHRNLVKLITSCSGGDFQGNEFKALIYEFMPCGSLDRWLHQASETEHYQKLNLLQRINIAIDVACTLDYIHRHCQKPVVHCDLKPSNILIDGDMTAHVSDFGLARFLPELADASQSSSLGIRGTIGYVAPEYGIGNEPSTYGDVYSYGILLLEMVTGRRPTDSMLSEDLNLHNFVKMALPDRVMEIVDPSLVPTIAVDNEDATATATSSRNGGGSEEECLRCLAEIGVACSMEAPEDRIEISKVVSDLHSLRNILLHNGVR